MTSSRSRVCPAPLFLAGAFACFVHGVGYTERASSHNQVPHGALKVLPWTAVRQAGASARRGAEGTAHGQREEPTMPLQDVMTNLANAWFTSMHHYADWIFKAVSRMLSLFFKVLQALPSQKSQLP
jgi:hypothetical protein